MRLFMANEEIKYVRQLTAADFVTSKEEIRAGFLAMALEKNAVAIPHIKEAKVLHALAKQAETARDLIQMEGIRAGLVTASGLSAKAVSHLSEQDQQDLLLDLIENILEPAGRNFPDELVYRYLLIKGDSMGGSMRNLAGALGQSKLIRMVISSLAVAGREFWWKDADTGRWVLGVAHEEGIENRTKALYWKTGGRDRLFLTNLKFPIVEDSNVDIALFEGNTNDYKRNRKDIVQQYTRVIALGELKAGIDPAGADEHWKTANFALNRIRSGFAQQGANPKICFVAAAISPRMGRDICQQIKTKLLTHASNLTNDEQLAMTCSWLTSL